MNNEGHNSTLSVDERKKILIAQGAAYRNGVRHATTVMRSTLTAESLAKSAISHLVMGVFTAFRSGAILKGGSLPQLLLPLVMSGISRLSNKSLLRPVARGVLIVGAVAAIAQFFIKMKKATKAETQRAKIAGR